LASVQKADGKTDLTMKEPDVVVPLLVLLYASFGFSAQVVSQFQLNRQASQWKNTIEYAKIGRDVLVGSNPAQLKKGMEGLRVTMPEGSEKEKNGTLQYFPPRTTRPASAYGEVGFLNLNSYSGGSLMGYDRAGCLNRWFACHGKAAKRRNPVEFDDGFMDLFRQRQPATMFKTGTILQTDKRKAAIFEFEPAPGHGIFMQYDGEGRFVFQPDGKGWRMDAHQVLQIPVVLGPSARPTPDGDDVAFRFVGDEPEVARIKTRIQKWVNGELVKELNATREDIERAGLPLASTSPISEANAKNEA